MGEAVDLETAIERVVAHVVKAEGFRLPLHVASIAANGAVLFTRFEEAPPGSPSGSVVSEHIAGEVDDEGFAAPIDIMVKDAIGRIRIARQGSTGTPVFRDLAVD